MFGNVNGCARVRSFEECQRHFELTPEPTFPRGGHNPWEPNERPLDDKTKHHYRIVRGPNEEYYDAVLYSTTMARYYRPEEGGRRVQYHDDDRGLSRQFMWRLIGSAKVMYMPVTEGPSRYFPAYGADLWLTGSNHNPVIDLSRSKHAPIEVPRMSDELKAWKKEVRKELAPVFELMKYSVEGAAYEPRKKRHAFAAHTFDRHTLRYVGWEPGDPLTEKAAQVLVDMYQERLLGITDDYHVRARIRAVEASILGELAKMYRGSHFRYEPLPQFPEVLPRNFLFA